MVWHTHSVEDDMHGEGGGGVQDMVWRAIGGARGVN